MPEFVRYSGSLISRTMAEIHREKSTWDLTKTLTLLAGLLYMALTVTIIFLDWIGDLVATVVLAVLLVWFYMLVSSMFRTILRKRHFSEMGLSPLALQEVFSFVANIITSALLVVYLIVMLWSYAWYLVPVAILLFVSYSLVQMKVMAGASKKKRPFKP